MKLFVCVLLVALLAMTASAADVSGKWSGTFTADSGDGGGALLILKQSGTTISGTAGPDENQQWPVQSGKVDGDKVSIEVKSTEDGTIYKCELTLSGDTMKGPVVVTPAGSTNSMKGTLELSRVKS